MPTNALVLHYLQDLGNAFPTQMCQDADKKVKGSEIAQLLSLNVPRNRNLRQPLITAALQNNFSGMCSNFIQQGRFSAIIQLFLKSYAYEKSQRALQAVTAAEAASTKLLEIFSSQDSNTVWLLPIVDQVMGRYRLAASAADDQLIAQGKPVAHLSKVYQDFMPYFQTMQHDRREISQSKKMGCLFVIVHGLKICFKINQFRLCDALLRSQILKSNLERFPKAQTTAFYFYRGRLTLINNKDYKAAEADLAMAFRQCPDEAFHNKRRILQFLIPLRLRNNVVCIYIYIYIYVCV